MPHFQWFKIFEMPHYQNQIGKWGIWRFLNIKSGAFRGKITWIILKRENVRFRGISEKCRHMTKSSSTCFWGRSMVPPVISSFPVILQNSRSNFWSSKVCEGGSHVKHMHADSLLIHPNFSSKLMITWLILFEKPLLIHFQTDQKFNFVPVRTNEGGSKVKFRTIYDHVIDKYRWYSYR